MAVERPTNVWHAREAVEAREYYHMLGRIEAVLERIAALPERAKLIGAMGVAGEASYLAMLRQEGVSHIDLNDVRHNFKLVDAFSERDGFVSVKTYSGDRALTRYLRALDELRNDRRALEAARDLAADTRTELRRAGRLNDPDIERLAHMISKEGKLAVPSDHVQMVRDAVGDETLAAFV